MIIRGILEGGQKNVKRIADRESKRMIIRYASNCNGARKPWDVFQISVTFNVDASRAAEYLPIFDSEERLNTIIA